MSAVWSSGFRNPSVRIAANAPSLAPLSSLVYQSRAIAPLSETELQRLLSSAQARNRKEGITGLLVYDQCRFLQWLEGPTQGLGRVWQSIRRDSRHTDITLLGQSATPVRLFGDSAMALGKCGGDLDGEGKRRGEISLPAELIEALYLSPQAAPAALARLTPGRSGTTPIPALVQHSADSVSLKSVVENLIIPELLAQHVRPVAEPLPLPPVIDPRSGELAKLLLAADPYAAFALIDTLRADGRSIAQLCAGLLEPAARALGALWQSDDCSEIAVCLGLGHLQVALRRASLETSTTDVPHLPSSTPHAVLVAPSPYEPHLLGSVIASEIFWRAGWDVRCEFPDSDAALNQLVHDRWFDVLDLSLSGAFTREHRLPAMAASIRAVHAHSLNPALTVIVDGRVFNERPQAFAEVGADAGSKSAVDVVSAAQRGAKTVAG